MQPGYLLCRLPTRRLCSGPTWFRTDGTCAFLWNECRQIWWVNRKHRRVSTRRDEHFAHCNQFSIFWGEWKWNPFSDQSQKCEVKKTVCLHVVQWTEVLFERIHRGWLWQVSNNQSNGQFGFRILFFFLINKNSGFLIGSFPSNRLQSEKKTSNYSKLLFRLILSTVQHSLIERLASRISIWLKSKLFPVIDLRN